MYFNSLDEFRNSEAGKNLQPNDTIKSWFKIHGNKFNHLSCTPRPIDSMPNQAWWIYDNYCQWIHTVHAVGTNRDGDTNYQTEPKGDFISWINKEVVFVDDSEKNITAVSTTGAETILYHQP